MYTRYLNYFSVVNIKCIKSIILMLFYTKDFMVENISIVTNLVLQKFNIIMVF